MVVWLTNVTRVMLQRLVAFGNWYDLQIQARAFLCEAADTRDLYCIYIYILYIYVTCIFCIIQYVQY